MVRMISPAISRGLLMADGFSIISDYRQKKS
jgi:hypothetical protein